MLEQWQDKWRIVFYKNTILYMTENFYLNGRFDKK